MHEHLDLQHVTVKSGYLGHALHMTNCNVAASCNFCDHECAESAFAWHASHSLAPNPLSYSYHMQALRSLEVLDLHNNLMETLTGLTALTNLRRLNLASNRISSICSFSMLTSLEDLDLNRNFLVSLAVPKPVPGDVDADRTGGVEETCWPASLRKLSLAANRYSLPFATPNLNLVCICQSQLPA